MLRSLVLALTLLQVASAFTAITDGFRSRRSVDVVAGVQSYAAAAAAATTSTVAGASTVVDAPTREKTDTKTNKRTGRDRDNTKENDSGVDDWDYPDLEYLQDAAESREMNDPFHILLLGSTFEKPKVTVDYVCGSLEYVLGMPAAEAIELASFAEEHGLSCLGTWPREECLSLGKQLQVRDIVCRVVPFAEGGQRGWQAKDASSGASSAGAGSEGWSSQ